MTLDPDAIPRKSFETSFRGYDPMEVQAFLLVLADELRAARDRELDLELRLSEAERRAREAREEAARRLPPAPPPAPAIDSLDNAEIARLIGEETARVLESARSAADDIRHRAGVDAESVLSQATERARARVSLAEQEVSDARQVAATIVAEARSEVDELLLAARAEADELLAVSRREAHDLVGGATEEAARLLEDAERDATAHRETSRSEVDELVELVRAQAEADAAAMVDEAGALLAEARERRRAMLDDLSVRRHQALAQLEQLRAGRDHLAQVLEAARSTLDELAVGVDGALDGAREAALDARSRVEAHAPAPIAAEGVADEGVADESGAPGGVADASGAVPALPRASNDPSEPAATEAGAIQSARAGGGATSEVDPSREGDEPEIVTSLFARIRADQEAFVGADYPGARSTVQGHDGLFDVDVSAPASSDGGARDDDAGALDGPARDRALAGPERGLGRALKRVLSEEQNEVLDGVRSAVSVPPIDEVVGDAEAHALRYAAAARGELRDAVYAGAAFAEAGRGGGGPAAAQPEIDDLAAQMSVDLVGQLRDQLAAAWAGAGDDQLQLLERLRPIYRSWRGRQLPELASRYAAEAFNRGLTSVPGVDVADWLVPVP